MLSSLIPSSQDMILIFLVVLLLFGAKKIPELARGVAKGMGEFKKAREDFEKEIVRGEEEARVNRAATPVTTTATATPEDMSRASRTSLTEYEKDLAKKEEELKAREAALAVREAAGKEAREHA